MPETGGMALQVTNVIVKLAFSETAKLVIVPFEMQRRHGETDVNENPTLGEEI